MTSIAELLKQEPLRVDKGISLLVGRRLLNEVENDNLYSVAWDATFALAIDQVVFHEVHFDHRRSQIIFGVRYAGDWVGVCRRAGRELDDYNDLQIVDAERYVSMITYLKTELAKASEVVPPPVHDLCSQVEFEFYGHDVREPAFYW